MITIEVDFEKTISDLEKLLGGEALTKHIDAALMVGAEFMRQKIRDKLLEYKDTGAMANELVAGEPFTFRERRTISLHWRGPEKRYEIVHLNERGYYLANGKFHKPAAYGQIEATVNRYISEYISVVQEAFFKEIGAV